MTNYKLWVYPILFVLGVLAGLYFNGCNNSTPKVIYTHSHTEHHDTVHPLPVIIKLPPKNKFNIIDSVKYTYADTNNYCRFIRNYTDSVYDKNITIYTKDSIQGRLLGKNTAYRLKVPLIINNTITDIDSVTIEKKVPVSALFATGYFGMNEVSVGASFIGKKGLGGGYKYNALRNEHCGIIYYRIFPFKQK